MTTPRCPYCNAQGLKSLAILQAGAFAVIYCDQCGAIHGIVPMPRQAAPERPPLKEETPRDHPIEPEITPPAVADKTLSKSPDFIAEISDADLAKKHSYSPERIAAAMRASGINRGTLYRQFITDVGPPFCPQHQVEMQQFAIPGGKNKYKLIWICPEYECREWELVE